MYKGKKILFYNGEKLFDFENGGILNYDFFLSMNLLLVQIIMPTDTFFLPVYKEFCTSYTYINHHWKNYKLYYAFMQKWKSVAQLFAGIASLINQRH